MVVYVIGIIPASALMGKMSLKIIVLTGSGLTLLGAAVRCIPIYALACLFLGQTIAAIAQLFVLSIPPAIAVVWFPPAERGKATALGSLANALGIAASFGIGPLFSNVIHLMLSNVLICTIGSVMVLILMRDPPNQIDSEAYDQKFGWIEIKTD